MIFFKKQKLSLMEKDAILYKKENDLFEKENKEIFKNLTDDQKALIINFAKVENTGKVISEWDDSFIGVYHKEVVYDGGIKAETYNCKFTISSNDTKIVFESYSPHNDKIMFIESGFSRLSNIQSQIKQGKITIEDAVIKKAEKMFNSDNDKEKDLEKNDENIEKNNNSVSEDDYDYYNDIE